MRLAILFSFFLLFALMFGCSSGGGGNIIDDTLKQLKEEGIGLDKATFLDLFRFFLQLKKDYQSITLLPPEFKRMCAEAYCKIMKAQIKTKDPKEIAVITSEG